MSVVNVKSSNKNLFNVSSKTSGNVSVAITGESTSDQVTIRLGDPYSNDNKGFKSFDIFRTPYELNDDDRNASDAMPQRMSLGLDTSGGAVLSTGYYNDEDFSNSNWNSVNSLVLGYSDTTLKNPLTVSSGGTGASTKTEGQRNLIDSETIRPASIRFTPSTSGNHGGYLDFYFENASSLTSNIIERPSGTLCVNGVNFVRSSPIKGTSGLVSQLFPSALSTDSVYFPCFTASYASTGYLPMSSIRSYMGIGKYDTAWTKIWNSEGFSSDSGSGYFGIYRAGWVTLLCRHIRGQSGSRTVGTLPDKWLPLFTWSTSINVPLQISGTNTLNGHIQLCSDGALKVGWGTQTNEYCCCIVTYPAKTITN